MSCYKRFTHSPPSQLPGKQGSSSFLRKSRAIFREMKPFSHVRLQKKKFEIRAIGTPDGRKFTYYTGSDERSKYLLSQCETTHLFHMSVLPRYVSSLHRPQIKQNKFMDPHVFCMFYGSALLGPVFIMREFWSTWPDSNRLRQPCREMVRMMISGDICRRLIFKRNVFRGEKTQLV